MEKERPGNSNESDNEPMPFYEPNRKILVGAAARMEAQVLGLGLPEVCGYQTKNLDNALKYALNVSTQMFPLIREATMKQREAQYKQMLGHLSSINIRSLNIETTEETVRKAFEVFGPLKVLTMKIDPNKVIHKYAFLSFHTPEAAICALNTMNERLLDNWQLKVRFISKRTSLPNHIMENLVYDAQNKHHRIYVSPLHSDLNEKNLERLFRTYGDVLNVKLVPWPSRRNSNFAYIQFENNEAADAAVEGMNKSLLYGQTVYVCGSLTPPDAHYLLFSENMDWTRTAQSYSTFAVKHHN